MKQGFQKGHKQFNTGRTHFKKGFTPWNKNKKLPSLSEEQKRKISKALTGHKTSKETREKISKSQRGKKLSSEHIEKLRLSKLGRFGKNANHWQGGNFNRAENYKKWVKNNSEKIKVYSNNRRARKLKAEGIHTFGEWELLKKQYGYICPSCKKSEPEIKLTEDHIIPLSKGGSNWIENIQPLCGSCNSKKHTDIIKFGGNNS